MSSPAYDGQGQPARTTGWLAGLVSWWNAFTPTYVTNPSGPRSALLAAATNDAVKDAPRPLAAVAAAPTANSSAADAASGAAKP